VVAGTATATANAVNNRQAKKAADKQATADQQAADQQAADQQAADQQAAYQQQSPPPQQYPPQQAYQAPPVYQAPPAPPAEPASGGGDDIVGQIGQLAKLKEAGVLSDAEFAAAKAKLLGI
jgi:hypothetical protein